NWLRSPSKSTEWLWDSAQLSLGAKKTLEILPGWFLKCHPYAYKVYYESQIADPEQSLEFKNFTSHCAANMLLFDIGAHFGVFSLAAAHYGGRAIAVDPSPMAMRMVATEISLNSCPDRIQTLQAAVSDAKGVMEMLTSGVFSAGYFRVANGRLKKDLTRTRATTIDEMAFSYGVPTHIKIDVEGYEAAVLRGAREILSRASPLLFVELHNEMVAGDGGDPSAAIEELARYGYATFSLEGAKISREAILQQPIIRVVAKRRDASGVNGN
ncbi:MAG: FkbM family methyltransferase, partial [Candidatus Acidiferrales bacterium]